MVPTGDLKKDLKSARFFMKYNRIEAANIYYSSIAQNGQASTDILWEAGKNLLLSYQPKIASSCFKKVINQDYNNFPAARYYLSKSLAMSGNYLQALKELKIFQDNYFGLDKDSINNLVTEEIKQINASIRLSSPKSNIKLKEISWNDNLSNPSYISLYDSNEIIVGTRQILWNGNFETEPKWKENAKTIEVLRHTTSLPEFYSTELFNPNYLNSSFTYTPDKQFIYFTRSVEDANNSPITQIFYCKRSDFGWSKPIRMNELINERGYSSKQPFLFFDNGTVRMYYSTNIEEGNGGFDLWVADLDSTGNAIRSENLETSINTSADEITPFYDTTLQVLYFSSNKLGGYGGFDIYKSEKLFGKHIAPVNLGSPLNSSYNDYNYCFDEYVGFLLSDRNENDLEAKHYNKIYSFIPNEFMLGLTISNPLGNLYGFQVIITDSSNSSPTVIHRVESNDTISANTPYKMQVKLKPNKHYVVDVSSNKYCSKKLDVITIDSSVNRKLNFEMHLLPFYELIFNVKKYSLSQIPLSGKWEVWKLNQSEIELQNSVEIAPKDSIHKFKLESGSIYLIKYISETFNAWDTLINTTKINVPLGRIMDVNITENIYDKVIYIDSVKVNSKGWINKISNQKKINQMIDHLQIFHSQKPTIVLVLNYKSEREGLGALPEEVSSFIKDISENKQIDYVVLQGEEEEVNVKRIDIKYSVNINVDGKAKD